MMYSEFIERTKYEESYITPTDYDQFIEPVYMAQPASVDKNTFCKRFKSLARKIIDCPIEIMMSAISTNDKMQYIATQNYHENEPIPESFERLESAHQMLKIGFLKNLSKYYK